MPGDPLVVYRIYWSLENHTVDAGGGRRRLASSLFKTQSLSVDDGALVTPQQASAQFRTQPNGVASLPKRAFSDEGMALNPDPPEHPEFRAEHRTAGPISKGLAKRLLMASRVVIQHPGFEVLDPEAATADT